MFENPLNLLKALSLSVLVAVTGLLAKGSCNCSYNAQQIWA